MYSVVPYVDVRGSYFLEAECFFRLAFVPGLSVHGGVIVIERVALFSIQKDISQLRFAGYLLWNILPQYLSAMVVSHFIVCGNGLTDRVRWDPRMRLALLWIIKTILLCSLKSMSSLKRTCGEAKGFVPVRAIVALNPWRCSLFEKVFPSHSSRDIGCGTSYSYISLMGNGDPSRRERKGSRRLVWEGRPCPCRQRYSC